VELVASLALKKLHREVWHFGAEPDSPFALHQFRVV
jgi:hypothetical protein